jgi:asparagine synthetase B (glutamine-hydrolysing)
VSDPLYVMSPLEVAWGSIFGHIGTLPPAADPTESARQALERVVLESVRRTPCGVAFSGGRDSSLVLAVATHVARREGLPDPVPVSRVFPDVTESQEHTWQETVIRHLGLADWERTTIHDELDIVGPIATRIVRQHGVLWPPTLAGDVPLVDAVRGGSMMDGEGGDEVLGSAAHRIAPLARVLRSPRPVRWRRARRGLGAVAPSVVRARLVRRRWSDRQLPWLRPATREALLGALAADEARRPLSFAESVRRVPRRRTQVLGAQNREVLCEPSGVRFASPLLHPDVVQALAREGGFLGGGDRSDVLRRLAPDLLPDAVLARTSKATFTRCYMGEHARRFAEQWDGTGVDADLVDPEALRRSWLAETPNALTSALMQAAWLAQQTSSTGATGLQQSGVAPGQPA